MGTSGVQEYALHDMKWSSAWSNHCGYLLPNIHGQSDHEITLGTCINRFWCTKMQLPWFEWRKYNPASCLSSLTSIYFNIAQWQGVWAYPPFWEVQRTWLNSKRAHSLTWVGPASIEHQVGLSCVGSSRLDAILPPFPTLQSFFVCVSVAGMFSVLSSPFQS